MSKTDGSSNGAGRYQRDKVRYRDNLDKLIDRHAKDFNAAKDVAVAGLVLGLLLWFGGFLIVGGEWFQMWQSKSWNGQEAAFRFIPAFRHVLVYTAAWLGSLMVFVVGLALLLHGRASRVSAAYRFLFYIPGGTFTTSGNGQVKMTPLTNGPYAGLLICRQRPAAH